VARAAVEIELSEEEERRLRAVLRTPSASQQQAVRARIVLRAAEGATNTEIAAEAGVSLPTVGLWRRSFSERGLAGLMDAPRSGRPRRIDDDEVQRVLALTLEPPPDGTTHWSVRRLAKATGISPTTVHRIWREHKLKVASATTQEALLDNARRAAEAITTEARLAATEAAALAQLRAAEQGAVATLMGRLNGAPASLAQLYASIAASEATHATVLTAAEAEVRG